MASTFSRKRLFGYHSLVWATIVITVLSFIVWVHHFFTMGAGPNVNAFFGIMTMIIAVPTGVKIFTWLFTMYRGRVRFETPMLWTVGFIVTFSIGGMTGVLLAVPGADFLLHNSLFLIAHFHNVIIGEQYSVTSAASPTGSPRPLVSSSMTRWAAQRSGAGWPASTLPSCPPTSSVSWA